MKIKLRQSPEITAALETVVTAFLEQDGDAEQILTSDDGRTIDVGGLISAASELELTRSEQKALDVLEHAHYNKQRNFAKLKRKLKFD